MTSRPSRSNPYLSQPRKAFWKQTVSDSSPTEITDWYQKKFDLDGRISVAGSCFAQHVGRRLRQSGFNLIDTEPFVDTHGTPPFLSAEVAQSFGFNMYSARYGNIYTARQLLQLFLQAFGAWDADTIAWPHRGGFVDCFRPTIEPEPYVSIDQVRIAREAHLKNVRQMFSMTDIFVFTLGLTEAWTSTSDGAVYPVAPGVAGGAFDTAKHSYVNFDYSSILADLEFFLARFRELRPDGKLLLTVSPVPLVATASNEQVVVANTYSKSVLRSVAGFLSQKYPFVGYFPSYEIISSAPMRGMFFASDMREVLPEGVNHVMQHFFAAHPPPGAGEVDQSIVEMEAAVACDDELLRKYAAP